MKVFGDESADETQSRVFAVAGVVGNEIAWQAAEDEWVKCTDGEVFHAAECEHRNHLGLYKDLTQILVRSRLAAHGVALDLMAVQDFFPGSLRDLGYYGCFLMVTQYLTEKAQELQQPIEFTFDHRGSDANAGILYSLMTNNPDWEAKDLMAENICFESRDNPRIQMADLVARETMKSLDNQMAQRSPRKSMLALCNEGHLSINVLDRQYCADWRADMDRLEDEKGISGARYADWLSRYRRRDSWSNRFRYLALHQEKEC